MSKVANEVNTEVATQAAKVNKITAAGWVLEDLYKEFKTVSGVIRKLNSEGFTRGEIADFTGKRYQHVRNVLVEDARKAADKK